MIESTQEFWILSIYIYIYFFIFYFYEELCMSGNGSTAVTISLQCQTSNVESAYLNRDLFYLTAQPRYLPT